MANEQNLIPQAHILTVEEQSKGGQKSAQVRIEKKTVQKILNDFLEQDVSESQQFNKLAKKIGIEGDKSIKDLFTIVCLMNTIKKGDLSDLERLSKLLGEQTEVADTEAEKQTAFLDAVKKAVTDAD